MKGHILILIANILFGVSMPVFKYLLTSDFPPEAITYMRAAFACVMFWFVSFFIAPEEKVPPKDLGLLVVCGLCGVGFNQWMFVTGLRSSSPVDASIIATAVPIFVLLLAAVVLEEPITAKKSAGVLLGVGGGLLLVYSSAHTTGGEGSLKGDMLMLLNQMLYSVYLVLSKSLSSRYSSVTVMKWMFLFSVLALTPFCLRHLQEVPVFHQKTFDGTELCALLYLLVGATFLSFMLIPMALKYIRPTTVSMYNYVQPIVASGIAISIGQDTFSLQKLTAAVSVFAGVWLVTKSKKRENKQIEKA
ncbi:DMT family transporter [Gabonibacter chumensis]|uniref:DMT family transporter n=1 Tax=Gabonibacter chumensis TaxID=2972474 RepID=UPI002572F17E|nr:DMT family transporter [Gabonibacter chumensis]MCR9012293.1 DMT family transporter [Gabonibacter chumensis]